MFERIISYICIGLFLISSVFLNSCAQLQTEIPNAVVGKWEHSGHVFEYSSDGTLSYDGEAMKYEIIDGDTLRVMRNDGTERDYYFDYTFNSDGTLTVNEVKYFPVI